MERPKDIKEALVEGCRLLNRIATALETYGPAFEHVRDEVFELNESLANWKDIRREMAAFAALSGLKANPSYANYSSLEASAIESADALVAELDVRADTAEPRTLPDPRKEE